MKHKKPPRRDDRWNLTHTEYVPEEQKLRETLATIGNGYFGTRGAMEEERDSEFHYPGTYIAGVYNKLPSTVHGKVIHNDDFVNCPNWLLTELRIGRGGNYVSPINQEILSFENNLNMRDAVVSRMITFKDRKGRITRIESSRFASMSNPHHAALRYTVTPVNYSSPVTIRSSLDGTVTNNGVARYRNLSSHHLEPVDQGPIDDGMFVQVETNQSHTTVVMSAKHALYGKDETVEAKRRITAEAGLVSETLTFEAVEGQSYTLEKLVSIATSRDENSASAIDAARTWLARSISYDEEFKTHRKEWRSLWNMADIRIEGDHFSQKVIRLHMYHLLATASPHSIHIDAGMPARGLHGEAYRGHIFWDSIYVLPVFYQRFPEVAKAALMYRYRRLDAARNYAREYGFEGAMFPWQSSNDGSEETQIIHYNPVSDKWDPDLSSRQRHVSIAIFYNIWEYYSYTGDEEFLHHFGAEMLVEIARFWASIAIFEESDKRYHIHGVMGPDEFHEKYPGAALEKGGISDNAYTNIMVVWLLEKALEALDELPDTIRSSLIERIAFKPAEKEKWRDISHRMFVPITKDGIVEQFAGYMNLKELDWEYYRNRYGNIHRMDRILKSEGDSPDGYKVAKQADALMPFYLLPLHEVIRILGDLGHTIENPRDFLRKNYYYYLQRTSHGSTLSKVGHSSISRHMDTPEETWRWFQESLESDIYDTQGGTTVEGIHCAVMGGTINIVSRVFGGVTYDEGKIDIRPRMPAHWKSLSFNLLLRGRKFHFEITHDTTTVVLDPDSENPMRMRMNKNGKKKD
jgi:trehalose/maltose hydrolase-like predicted phosphorylase